MAENGPSQSEQDVASLSRVELIWRLIVFQLKLVMDGLRDIVLSPVSLVAVLAGLIAGGKTPERYWNLLMRFGRRTDIWINLFDRRTGAADALVEPIARRASESREC
ncbi:MAG: hypothetical protein V3U43_10425 [Pseudomonadales bacterium]